MKSTEEWIDIFENSVSDTISLLQKEYLDFFSLKAVLVKDHNFTGPEKKWYGSYLRERNLLQQNIICFALNIPLIFKQMVIMGKVSDIPNIQMQAKVLTAHEIGHGLVDFLRLQNHPLPFPPLSKQEESTVQEFGLSFAPEYTHITKSFLKDTIYKMKKGQE